MKSFITTFSSDMDDGPDEFVTGVRTTDLTMTVVSPVTTVGDPNLIIITPGPEDLSKIFFKSLPNDKFFLDWSKLKAFADDKKERN